MVEKTYRKRRRRKSHYRKKKKTIRGSGSASRMVRGAYRGIRGVGPKFYPQTKQKDMLEGEGVFRTESFKKTILDYLDEASDKTMSYFKNVYDIIRYNDKKDKEKENMEQAVKLTKQERELSTKIKKFETKAPRGILEGDPVGMRAIVLQTTQSNTTGVLGVREDEVVEVVRVVDKNWWMVRHGGVQGLISRKGLQVVLEDGTPFTKATKSLKETQHKLEALQDSVRAVHLGKMKNSEEFFKEVSKYLSREEDFMMTYGDGLSDINLHKLLNFHNKQKKLATVTAVKPLARFGAMDIHNNNVIDFIEKPKTETGWINGGFFVLSYDVIKYISSCQDSWEKGPLPKIVKDNQLVAYKHNGFWQPMDTLREKVILTELWEKGNAPWKPKKNSLKNILAFKKSVNY